MAVTGSNAYWAAETGVPLDRRPVGTVVVDNASEYPHRTALLWPEAETLRAWTWTEVRDESEAFARRLLAIVEPGDVVAVFASNSPDWVFFEFGAAMAGVTFAAVNTALADAEVEHVLRASGARAVFADREFRGSPLLQRTRALTTDIPAFDLAAWRELAATDRPLPIVDADSSLLIQFTSGTTGKPKGAALSHLAAYNCARYQTMRIGGTVDDNWLNVMPMHHVGGSVCVLLAMLSVGATITLAPAFDPGPVLHLIEQSRATMIGLVPTMQLAVFDHPDFAAVDLGSLRFVISGGSVVPTSLIRRAESAFGATVVNAYGQSESPSASMTDPGDDDTTKAETIGQPLDQRDVRIRRADGSTADFDEIGELVMRSPLTMSGYLGSSAGTIDVDGTIDADGWLHTGDLCSMDARGVLRIHGRSREVIIRGGENVYPAEVEGVMLRHPAIADIAVIGMQDAHWGEVPVGCYRPATDELPADSDLTAFGRTALAGFKVPNRWIPLDAFPLTAAGKVKKFELREHLARTEQR
ncbi:MAG TPA: class I adenylate-forming enzyme family protein [Ilumatobacter sp.]|nr:class I adenylate-forming enzyme family protein [Ilumatobacter sp.]